MAGIPFVLKLIKVDFSLFNSRGLIYGLQIRSDFLALFSGNISQAVAYHMELIGDR
jgi:hypothetical protein